jgi:hypothetical protein
MYYYIGELKYEVMHGQTALKDVPIGGALRLKIAQLGIDWEILSDKYTKLNPETRVLASSSSPQDSSQSASTGDGKVGNKSPNRLSIRSEKLGEKLERLNRFAHSERASIASEFSSYISDDGESPSKAEIELTAVRLENERLKAELSKLTNHDTV